jgi:hypothetical protein
MGLADHFRDATKLIEPEQGEWTIFVMPRKWFSTLKPVDSCICRFIFVYLKSGHCSDLHPAAGLDLFDQGFT